MERPQITGLSEWRPLARGGLAVVWEARQLTLDRRVAVKVYQQELGEDDRGRFLREATAAGRLSDHPGIVTTHDAGILPDDRPYLIMELCPGGSLTQWLKPENRIGEERVRQVGVLIADALAAVHAGGVLHRDVKPANILINKYGNPGLADFGLASVAGADRAAPDALAVTPAYAPPEAFEMHPATESGDVFSLAATLYALLSGRAPRAVDSTAPLEQMAEVMKRPIDPLPELNWHLMAVLMAALSSDPAARPTAAQLRDQLANVAAPRSARRSVPTASADYLTTVFPSANHSPAGQAVTAATQPVLSRTVSAEAPRRRGMRRTGVLTLAAATVTVLVSTTAWLTSEAGSSSVPAPVSPSATTATPSGRPAEVGPRRAPDPRPPTSATPTAEIPAAAPSMATIQLQDPAVSAKPFQAVRIQGRHRDGAGRFLRVQRWDSGRWLAFPLPTKTDESGNFTTYVELGQPGRYRLRVIDPDSGRKSDTFVLMIKR